VGAEAGAQIRHRERGRLLQINRQNLKWTGRTASILILVAAADALAVYFVRKPILWAVSIPALIPVLTALFVIIPIMKAEKSASPSV
jgi:hypothetical protein